MFRNVGTVDLVVGSHVCPWFTEFLGDLERSKVNFPKSSLGDDGIFTHSLVFLIVSDKVLDGSTDSLALETVDVGSSDLTGQSGVFGEGLESSSTKRRSLDIDGWSQEADGVSGLGLLGK